jgi:hypothetical protein
MVDEKLRLTLFGLLNNLFPAGQEEQDVAYRIQLTAPEPLSLRPAHSSWRSVSARAALACASTAEST